MEPLTIGLGVAACAFGGAMLGMLAGVILPKHHLSAESKDVIKVVMAMTATISALVVSLMISTAKASFDEKDNQLRQQAAYTILLDRLMAQYGPETKEARIQLRGMTEDKLRTVWGEALNPSRDNPDADSELDLNVLRERNFGIETLQQRLLMLSPKNEIQKALKEKALDVSYKIAEGQWLLLEQLSSKLQWIFIALVTFWLAIVFMSFGVFAPRNMSVVSALFVGALSVGAALYIITELDSPYDGYITISSEPIRTAIGQLGK
jgi:hypothetical protein